jgi:hypothetical protein
MDASVLETLIHALSKLIPVMCVFGMPVALLWVKKHYAALEKGHVPGKLPAPVEERIKALEAHKLELEARVQTLETIVTSTDFDRRPALEAPKAQAALPAAATPRKD